MDEKAFLDNVEKLFQHIQKEAKTPDDAIRILRLYGWSHSSEVWALNHQHQQMQTTLTKALKRGKTDGRFEDALVREINAALTWNGVGEFTVPPAS